MRDPLDRLLRALGDDERRLAAQPAAPLPATSAACPSLARMRTALLREDWTPQETEHLRSGCPFCERVRGKFVAHLWHPDRWALIRHRGESAGNDDETGYHLRVDRCVWCRARLPGLLAASVCLRLDEECPPRTIKATSTDGSLRVEYALDHRPPRLTVQLGGHDTSATLVVVQLGRERRPLVRFIPPAPSRVTGWTGELLSPRPHRRRSGEGSPSEILVVPVVSNDLAATDLLPLRSSMAVAKDLVERARWYAWLEAVLASELGEAAFDVVVSARVVLDE